MRMQETADERWRPILGVEQILVSVIAMLNEPNISSPANVDAAVQVGPGRWRPGLLPFYIVRAASASPSPRGSDPFCLVRCASAVPRRPEGVPSEGARDRG
jgi:hypothetical protein